MLPFGSLLTQIPLIIIGALYMLYLGFYAVNKSKENTASADLEVKEQYVISTSVDGSQNFYLFNNCSKDRNDAVAGKYSFFDIYESDIARTEVIPVRETYSHLYTYCLFSRPPPSV
jgi:hypothetical protein